MSSNNSLSVQSQIDEIPRELLAQHINYLIKDDKNMPVLKKIFDIFQIDGSILSKIVINQTNDNVEIINFINKIIITEIINKAEKKKQDNEKDNNTQQKDNIPQKIEQKDNIPQKDNIQQKEIPQVEKQVEKCQVIQKDNIQQKEIQVEKQVNKSEIVFRAIVDMLPHYGQVHNGTRLKKDDFTSKILNNIMNDINFEEMTSEYLNKIIINIWCHYQDYTLFRRLITLKNFILDKDVIKDMHLSYEYIVKNVLPMNEDNILNILMSYFDNKRTLNISIMQEFLEKSRFADMRKFEKRLETTFIESHHFDDNCKREEFIKLFGTGYTFSKELITARLEKSVKTILAEFV